MVNGWLVKRNADETEATHHMISVVLAMARTHSHP